MKKFRQRFRIVLIALVTILALCLFTGCKCSKKYATISFDTNGGTAVSPIKVKKGNVIGELPTTSKTNYEFVGWFTSNDGGVQITSEYVVEKDMKLYAIFASTSEYVTITYDTDGGTPVSNSTIKKGSTLGSLPFTDKIGYSFLGWFTSNDGSTQVFEDDIVYTDVTLYACYEKQDINTVLPEFTEVSIDTDDAYYEIMIKSSAVIDERNLIDYVGIDALYGELPIIRVTQKDDYYILSPINGYYVGGLYVIELLSEDVEFVNLNIGYENDNITDDQIKTINLSIIGSEISEVEYKNGIVEISYDDILQITEDSMIIGENIFELVPLYVDSIIHIKSDDMNNDYYVKVVSINKVNNEYVIEFTDCDIDEIYDDFNFNANEIFATNERLLSENQEETDLILKELVNSLYDSDGTNNLTKMLANALNASPTVKKYASNDSSGSFSYADRITDKTGINITVEGLLEDLKITATIGTAKNPNFNGISIPAFNDDSWTMLQLNFEYEATLKNKVKIEASITITQYLYVWFSFNSDSKSGNFKVEATPFSQTDIEFKVLICSTDEADDDKKDDKKEEKKDISIEISNLVNGEGDSSNIIKDVQDMLENKGDAIELCKVPLFQASYVFGGVISLNFDLNFVIKVSFAAGVKIEASVLEATTIGLTGNYKTRDVSTYRRVTNGSDRYIFDFYAYGYLGIKAGIEGEITISFTGLKKVLRAGVGVEIGAYADLYGYLHYHAEERRVFKDIDTNGRHFQTLEGGVYFEMGIYLELKAFIGVGKKEYGVSKEFKFKLLEAGDKYLYVEPATNENLKIVFNENDEGKLNLDGIIPAEGKFLNIVTGEIVTRVLPTNSIRIISLSNIYKSDNKNHQILINEEKMEKRTEDIPSGKIALYYKGPNILFSSKSLGEDIEELKGFKQLAEITVYYIREGIEIPEEQLGKEITVTYQVEAEGKTEVVKTIKLIAGQSIDCSIPNEIIYYCKANGLLWDLNVNNPGCSYDGSTSGKEMLTEDKVYTFKTNKAVRFIAVEYMSDYYNNEWTMEIYAMHFGDVPNLSEKHLSTPTNIYVNYNVIRLDGSVYPMGTNEQLYKYDSYMHGTYGYETGVVLASFKGTKEEVTQEYNRMRNNEGTFAKYNDYFTYTLSGEYQKSLLNVIFYDNFGNYSNENVVSGSEYIVPNYWINNMNNTTGLRFVGWDTNDDGKVDILPNQKFEVTSNMILKPIMAGESYIITITDIYGNTTSYELNYGDAIPQSILDIINNSPLIQQSSNEDSFYAESYWRICTTDFVVGDNNTPYFSDVTLKYEGDISTMPACDLTFQAVKGELYHYITYIDETGGYFIVTNEDGTTTTSTKVKFAVKDGQSIINASTYGKIKYVKPQDTDEIKYIYYQYLDENGDLMIVSNKAITSPKTYHISWWKTEKNSYSIEFTVVFYDKYGNIIEKENKHLHPNLKKEKFDELVTGYDAEYEYLTSTAYFESLSEGSEYTYNSYANGILDVKSLVTINELTGEKKMVYTVCIQKLKREYTIYIDWNGNDSYMKDEEIKLTINSFYQCPQEGYYYYEEDPITHVDVKHIFLGFDSDNDGIVDYKPDEKILITSDLHLVGIWT